ncbi:DNA-directed RNA polymerase subunit alpha [Candidatus Karelsulcia muelleri]
MILSPAKIKVLTHSKTRGKFLIKPLSHGFGITIGNSLRRVLISSLEGYAIYYIILNGVTHELSSIDGVRDNITEIIFNLKQIRFKLKSKMDNQIPKHYTIMLTTKKEHITAGDLCGSITYFEVLNPNLLILTKELDTNLNITLGIKKGVGYVPVENHKKHKKKRPLETIPRGKIHMDTIFSPIRNVRFKVDNCEVHNSYEFDMLIIEISTDGSITPQNAFKKASSILRQHFTLFVNGKTNSLNPKDTYKPSKAYLSSQDQYKAQERIQVVYMHKVLKSKFSEHGPYISVRTLKGLKFAQLKTWADLVKFNPSDLLKVRNFGIKSFYELNNKMKTLGLYYGMDLSKYNLKCYISKDNIKGYKKNKSIITFREQMRQIVKLINRLQLRNKRIKRTNTNETPKDN